MFARPDAVRSTAFDHSIPTVLQTYLKRWVGVAASAAIALTALMPGPAFATVSEFLRSQSDSQGKSIVNAAKAMPPELYGRAPTTDPMTFGELVLHVAVGNYLFCSRIGGAAEPVMPAMTGSESKDLLVGRLQASFDFCNRSLVSLNDSKLSEVLKIGDLKTPRSMAILTLTGTWNAHLTMAQDYLVQNGKPLPAVAN